MIESNDKNKRCGNKEDIKTYVEGKYLREENVTGLGITTDFPNRKREHFRFNYKLGVREISVPKPILLGYKIYS